MQIKSLIAIALLALLAGPSYGKDKGNSKTVGSNIVGTWKLVSYVVEAKATGKKVPAMGEKPTGYVTFLPDKRVYFVLAGDGRKPATTDQERAQLLSTLVAYTGTYTIKDDTWTTDIEVAWNPEWTGTKQTRFFKVAGNKLDVLTPWREMPNWEADGMTRSVITFERSR